MTGRGEGRGVLKKSFYVKHRMFRPRWGLYNHEIYVYLTIILL